MVGEVRPSLPVVEVAAVEEVLLLREAAEEAQAAHCLTEAEEVPEGHWTTAMAAAEEHSMSGEVAVEEHSMMATVVGEEAAADCQAPGVVAPVVKTGVVTAVPLTPELSEGVAGHPNVGAAAVGQVLDSEVAGPAWPRQMRAAHQICVQQAFLPLALAFWVVAAEEVAQGLLAHHE